MRLSTSSKKLVGSGGCASRWGAGLAPLATQSRLVGALIALLCCTFAVPTEAQDIRGVAPTYTDRQPATSANAGAIKARIWAPGLDDGYVPQGLAIIGPSIYVSAYKSTDKKIDRGPCRLFRLDRITGKATATLDLPPACGHAGGLAVASKRRVWVVDTHVMHEIALAPTSGRTLGRVLREVRIQGPVKGSLATAHDGVLWLGGYEKDAPGHLHAFPLARLRGKSSITEKDATRSLAIPSKAQGAAFDGGGHLWIARSGSRLGELVEIDAKTGATGATHAAPDGIEGIAFATSGNLWALSEAGSRRWLDWPTFFPLIFELAPERLR
ncbi:MAG: hypothetical protein JSS20_00660 [Proteobacteria bacterium]|nr:hypothetical protein [Pseudomonadota bacterium]